MALKKSEKRLLGLLGVVALVFLVDRFLLSPGKEEPAPSQPAAARIQAADALLADAAQKTTSAPVARQYVSWGRDPFSTARSEGRTASPARGESAVQHELKGLFWKEGKAFALIDDMVLGEGEEDQGIRVDRIEGTEVLCRRGSRSFTLHWRESP